MSDKKSKSGGAPDNGRKRKILADLHSGMVLLARFADPGTEREPSGSRRSQEVRKALKTPVPPSRHRWN